MSKKEQALPLKPVGFKLLIALLPPKDKTKGGIIIPDSPKDREHTASIMGNVISMGPLAYKDDVKFPDGAWCKPGDWVMFKSYSGIRFKIAEQEFRLINDDTVEAVVDDPRLIERA